uniref:Peptidase S1 domain-containing protein n=1 Tax=Chelonoidis abingdonii TaxID=106734 RepID=A0A8C0JC38_CHEAB
MAVRRSHPTSPIARLSVPERRFTRRPAVGLRQLYWSDPAACSLLATLAGAVPPYTQGHRIVGGRNCLFGSRPYQVALLRNGHIYCGGSLIAPKWVLTAAHCKQIRRIHNFFMHPGYNLRPHDNDFMLLELDKPALLNSYVNTINLATCCPSPGTRCSVSGWGTIKSPQRQFPAIMQCADLYSVSQARCQASYSGRITENMLCAGVEQGGIGTCQVRGHPREWGRCRVSKLTQLNIHYPLRPANPSQPATEGPSSLSPCPQPASVPCGRAADLPSGSTEP